MLIQGQRILPNFDSLSPPPLSSSQLCRLFEGQRRWDLGFVLSSAPSRRRQASMFLSELYTVGLVFLFISVVKEKAK